MYNAIRKVHEAFEKAGIKHGVDQAGPLWVITTGMSGEHHTFRFLVIQENDKGNDINIRAMTIASVPPHRIERTYKVLNDIQQKFRYVRLVIDKDGDIHATYDFPLIYPDIGQGALEVLLAMAKILDDAYPMLQRAL